MNKDILYPLRYLHGQIYEIQLKYRKKREYRKQFLAMQKKNPKTVLLILTPDHGNMGDHAIAYAESLMLKEHGIDYFEISITTLYEWKYQRMLDWMNGFPILINGGGNLGTLWFAIEELQREIIRKNPKSFIAILPNSIYYEPNDWGNAQFEESKKLYKRHKRLFLYSRERFSHEIMSKAYNNVKLIPDVVLSLQQCGKEKKRNGCLLCMRNDCEKTRTEQQEEVLREQVFLMFGSNVCDTDMLGKSVPIEMRGIALQEKFDEFCGAELVITDRLHGMVFCAITGTPCIVIDSKSPKVKGCYEWIRHLDYIRFVENVSDIAKEFDNIPKKVHCYENLHLKHYYDELVQDILRMI